MAATRPRFGQINSSVTGISDPLIEVNSEQDPGQNNTDDLGLILNRGASGDNVAIIWDRTENAFVCCTTTAGGGATGDITISTYANLRIGTLTTNGGLIYPTVDGAPGQVLATDGAGNLSFTTVSDVIDGGSY